MELLIIIIVIVMIMTISSSIVQVEVKNIVWRRNAWLLCSSLIFKLILISGCLQAKGGEGLVVLCNKLLSAQGFARWLLCFIQAQ